MILEVPSVQSNKLDHLNSTKCAKSAVPGLQNMISRSVSYLQQYKMGKIIHIEKSSNYFTPSDFQVSSV